jgi:hypothetical protein
MQYSNKGHQLYAQAVERRQQQQQLKQQLEAQLPYPFKPAVSKSAAEPIPF